MYILITYNNNSIEYQQRCSFSYDFIRSSSVILKFILPPFSVGGGVIELVTSVDGLSMVVIMLVSITYPLLIYINERQRGREIVNTLLVMETLLLLTFTTTNIFIFFIFFELVLIPLYFILILLGSKKKFEAAFRLFIYSIFGSFFFLVGILLLFIKFGSTQIEIIKFCLFNSFFSPTLSFSFSFSSLSLHHLPVLHILHKCRSEGGGGQMDGGIALISESGESVLICIIFFLFLLPFFIKIPSFPFHT
jgi:NADH:ubiquinone oxidoreductase subunit 4 (subunit M)